MVADGSLSLETVDFDSRRWYEIDTLEDLREAELMFPREQFTGDSFRLETSRS